MRTVASTFLFLLLLAPSALVADILNHTPNPGCPGTSYATWYWNEPEGLVYAYVVDCGSSGTFYASGSSPISRPELYTAPVEEFWQALEQPLTINGTPTVDITTRDGKSLRLYKVTDSSQLLRYTTMLAMEIGGILPNGNVVSPAGSGYNDLINKWSRVARSPNPAQFNNRDLQHHIILQLYSSRTRKGAMNREESVAAMREYVAVSKHVDSTGSNILLRQLPNKENSFVLVVAPIRPELYGRVSVFNAAGETVWSDDVTADTTVDLSGVPSGTYFVQGMGRSIPVSIVR